MCIIIVAPPGKVISMDDLEDAIYENSDGAGYMIRVNGKLIIERSALRPDKVVATFDRLQYRYRDSWKVFHARLATQGTMTDVNTHPFNVPGTPWALAHNGILDLGDGPWSDRSDSRIFAEDHVANVTWQMLHDTKEKTEKWLGGSKVVILSSKKERNGPCLILNERLGYWSKGNGCWYSHTLYGSKWYRPTKGLALPVSSAMTDAARSFGVSEDDLEAWGYDPMLDEVTTSRRSLTSYTGKWSDDGTEWLENDGSVWVPDENDPDTFILAMESPI